LLPNPRTQTRRSHRIDALLSERVRLSHSQDLTNSQGQNSRFIHRFLLDPSSGPYVVRSIAHHELAFSCVANLNSAFSFRQDDPPRNGSVDLELALLKGHLGLCSYAIKYWISHVLAYLINLQASENLSDELFLQVNMLVKSARKSDVPPEQSPNVQILRGLQKLGNENDVRSFIQVVIEFSNKYLRVERTHASAEGQELVNEP
jgi:hypothetical protein